MTWENILKRKELTLERVLQYSVEKHRMPAEDKKGIIRDLLTELSDFPNTKENLRLLLMTLRGPDRDIDLSDLQSGAFENDPEIDDKAILDAHRKISKKIRMTKGQLESKKREMAFEEENRKRLELRRNYSINDMLD
jgi:hypothetical protein|tara:strand:+ start:829 stop:1239 length:411 start_codon:yes stop_codon:yes gene_type:complete